MILGFTGTRYGMTPAQKERFLSFFNFYNIEEFHHGDCVGADEDAHSLVRAAFPSIYIVTHPPTNPRFRANCRGDASKSPREYISRNHNIVDISHILIATPREMKEKQRSGTWATIRYARKTGKTLGLIYPDGTVVD